MSPTPREDVQDKDDALRSRLPHVLHNVPAAVLLVDAVRGIVVHANPAARALAGDRTLPLDAGAWVKACGLAAADGQPFVEGASPVELAARGEAVFGLAVTVRADGAARPLWVTAFPLPTGDEALVVLFEVDGVAPGAQVRDRALLAASLSFTISDPHLPDHPLVYVNPAFERTTGWSAAEVVGHNCRFLQGPDTDPAAVALVRELIRTEQHGVVTVLNQRKDGTAFWNELSLSPVYDADGALSHFVGIQNDVTSRVLAEQALGRHLEAEQLARADAQRAQRRLLLLAEATSMLAATLDVDESLRRLTDLVVPLIADWCTVDLIDLDGGVRRVAGRHADPARQPLLDVVEQRQPGALTDRSLTRQVLEGGPSVLLPQVPAEQLTQATSDPELQEAYRQLVTGSVIVVPLKARRQVLGALSLFTSDSGRVYDQDDLATAADLARRAALTVDNARLYQREHDRAEALQRSLLPTLAEVPGIDRAARYLPSAALSQVGGDWYDLLPLPDGTVGVAIGDVMGHDLTAAAAMGQLRSVLRSYAWQGLGPAEVLDRLDQLVQGLGMAQLATAVYGRITLPVEGRPGSLTYASAGHLPPVLRTPDGEVRFLEGGRSMLVGAALDPDRGQAEEPLPSGSMLVLYTDGLVEDRELDIEDGLAALAQAVREAPDAPAEATATALLDALTGPARSDDIALLVVKIL